MFSPSEIDSYNACPQKHYYAFGERLMAGDQVEAITRGNLGHAGLGGYYSTFLGKSPKTQLGDFEQGVSNMNLALLSYVGEHPEAAALVNDVMALLGAWADANMHELVAWEVIAVEQTFEVGEIAFTPDLIVRDRFGEVKMVDHKFVYNFYSDNTVNLAPQLPRYAALLRRQGLQVDKAEYNMIRHRKDAKVKFKRADVPLTPGKMSTYTGDMDAAGAEILQLKSMPLEAWRQAIQRKPSTFTCDHCAFTSLCLTDLEGRPGRDNLVKMFYKDNTYGYVKRDLENGD